MSSALEVQRLLAARHLTLAVWRGLIQLADQRLRALEERASLDAAIREDILRRGLTIIDDLIGPTSEAAAEAANEIVGIRTVAQADAAAIQALLQELEAGTVSAASVSETASRIWFTPAERTLLAATLTLADITWSNLLEKPAEFPPSAHAHPEYLDRAGGQMTGALALADWISVPSAAAVDLGAVASNYVKITGTASIAGFGSAPAGTTKILHFAAALVITADAQTMVLPFGVNSITTASDDIAVVKSEGGGSWRMLGYERKSGRPLALTQVPNYPAATAADTRAATAARLMTADLIETASAPVDLPDSAGTIAVDWRSFIGGRHRIGIDGSAAGTRTLGPPSAAIPNTVRYLWIQQDATGGRALNYDAAYKGDLPTLEQTANAWTLLMIACRDASNFVVSKLKAG